MALLDRFAIFNGHDLIVITIASEREIKDVTMFEKPMRFFDDDGTEVNPDLIAKPSLCTSCVKDDDQSQHHLCDLNRFDQQGEDEFKCGEYEPKEDE